MDFVENRNGKWWVPNPAHEDENFTDKWKEYPERREAFFQRHRDIWALPGLKTEPPQPL